MHLWQSCWCVCSESVATNQHEAIQAFIQGTVADGAPVVPISAQLKYNVDAVCEYIVKKIPVRPVQAEPGEWLVSIVGHVCCTHTTECLPSSQAGEVSSTRLSRCHCGTSRAHHR